MLDKIREVVRSPSKVVLLVAPGPVDLTLNFSIGALLVAGRPLMLEGFDHVTHFEHVDLAVMILMIDLGHVLLLHQHQIPLNLPIFIGQAGGGVLL